MFDSYGFSSFAIFAYFLFRACAIYIDAVESVYIIYIRGVLILGILRWFSAVVSSLWHGISPVIRFKHLFVI